MPFQTFNELNAEAMRLYQQGQFAEVYDLLTSEGSRFTGPEDAFTTLYLRSCMAARTGRPDMAISLIKQSFDRGDWYGEQLMRQSPSYAPLQGMAEFERLVEEGKQKQIEASAGAQLLVLEPEGAHAEGTYPALVALHGNTQSGQSALDGWRAIVDAGWLLAAIQSSQAASNNRYIWDDQDIALRDVESQFRKLQERYNLDPARLIIAGFSLGGATALRVALTGTIPATRFILLGPGGGLMDEPEGWRPLIEGASSRGLRGYILLGEREDEGLVQGVHATVKLLNEGGIACQLEVLPGLAHEYPADFGPWIARALAFVEQEIVPN
ncbi:MAG: hypothetical protein QOH93_755 [Chloroflexia bacterium]|jgi:predicted esterase|nr:hypothetical protein [Chloroflexia bacterium]